MVGSVLRVKLEMKPGAAGELGARLEDVAQEAIDARAATYASDAHIDVDQHLRAQLSGRGISAAANEEYVSEMPRRSARVAASGWASRMGRWMTDNDVESVAHEQGEGSVLVQLEPLHGRGVQVGPVRVPSSSK
jgi:hypothetical protein